MTNFLKKIGISFGYAANNPDETWEEARLKYFSAIKRDDPATIERLAKKYPDALTWDDGRGQSLFAAINANSVKAFEKMLDLGVSPDLPESTDGFGITALAYTSRFSDRAKPFIDILMARGATKVDEALFYGQSMDYEGAKEVVDYIRYRDTERQKAPTAIAVPPAPAAASPASNTQQDLTVLKPAKVQRRVPNTST